MKPSPLGPMRKYYYLTDDGLKELNSFIASWNEIKTNVSNVLEDYNMLMEIKLKLLRYREQRKLNPSNLFLYKAISTYLMSSNIAEIEKEEALQSILDMIIQAQIEGRDTNLIVGNSYEAFCDEIIKEYNSTKKSSFFVLIFIQKVIMWLFAINMFYSTLMFIKGDRGFWGFTTVQLITSIIICIFLVPILRKNSQKNSFKVTLRYKLYTFVSDI